MPPRCRTVCQRNTGSVLAPMSAFLLLQGIETMALRMERHIKNTTRVAAHLYTHPRVEWCQYSGHARDANHALARKYLGGHGPAFLTFGVKGGFEAGKKFHDALKLFKRLVNIGDTKSLACHPASTTHRQLTPEQLEQTGVTPETIRLCIGIEHVDDIIADLDQALEASAGEVVELKPRRAVGLVLMPAILQKHGRDGAATGSSSASSTTCRTRRCSRPRASSSTPSMPRRRRRASTSRSIPCPACRAPRPAISISPTTPIRTWPR